MSRNYTHYWANKTCTDIEGSKADEELLDHTAGNQFRSKGVFQGDYIYVITVQKGRLYLIGKLKAAQIVDLETAAAIRGDKPEELWDAEDHILASEATPMVFTRVIPKVITQKLRFVNKKSRKPPILTEDGLLDRQTLRGVRQLDNNSAIELDRFLPPMQKVVM